MQIEYKSSDLSKIIDQALVYQCACPAEVCNALIELRELYDYQVRCMDRSDVDHQVHEAIADSTAKAHQEMEAGLKKVLELEGWDPLTLTMPAYLKKKTAKPI